MKKVTLIALLSLLCLLFIVPNAFAFDNQTVNATDGGDVLSGEYYFDINIENDTGDGSRYNPYKEFTPERIEDNSVFYLADGEYTLTRNVKVNNVTIIGQNPQKTVITYVSTHNGLESKNSLTLKNLTLVNLPIMSKGDLTATNVLFCNAHADKGGAICADNNDETCITLNNCTFYNNNAQYGGAIYLSSGALIIEGSSFISNYATFYGGAITTESSNVTVRKSKFINDYTLKGDGGAMVIYNSDNFTGHDLEFTRCYATFGGALSILHSFSDLKNIVAKSNRAKYDGGAIYSMYLTLSMTDCTFDNNSASNGGAVYADMEEILYISNNHFVNNMAAKNGGAVYSILSDTYDLSILTEMNNTFHNNNASLNNDVFQSDVVDLAIGSRNYSLIRFIPSYNGTLPESYDLRQLGWVTPVKNQGSNGNCWAFAALASLESCLLKVLNVSYDLSEANMKNLMGLFSDYGWAMATNTGGYDKMAIGYLTSWMGPVNESDDEYYIGNLLSPILNSMFHIQNVKYLTRTDYNDNDAIKRAIIDYGAVSTSIYWSSSYLRGKNYYNNGANAANHAVTIVGWDDDYSKSNFRTAPPGDGAWIIKNSWGTGSGEKGFVYVSYYDAKLAPLNKPEATFTFILNDTIKFDKNYQYDIPGKTDYLLNFTDTVWYKNKFIATDDEYLAAVSTFFEKETSWELSVYVNDVLKAFKSGKSLPSYSTINLDEFIPLKSGDSFEIMFKITVDGDAGVPISEEISLNNILYTENISYISYDGKHWKDLFNLSGEYPNHNYYSQVACIKAFTFLNPINSSVILEICNVRSNLLDIIANVVDEYGNPIRSGKVTFDVANTKKTVDVVNGIARMENVEIKPGINRYEAQFSANAYVPSIDSVLFSSPLINTVLSLGFSSLDVNPIEITASVVDEYGNAVLCGHVTFNVEGINYTVDVEDGVAKLVRTFDFGVKNVSAVYGDAYCYNASYDEKTIVIYGLDTFVSISVDSKYNPVPIRVGVIDENGEKVNQGYVRFTLDNQNYIVNVTDGRAGIEHVFKRLQGSKRVTATYFDDSYKYHSSENFTYIDVELKSSNMELNVESGNYTNPVELVATITDGDNNTIDEGIVRFNIDGVWFDVNVVNGTAALDGVFTDVGLNNVTVSYDGLYYYKPSQIDVCLNISKIPVNLSFGVEKSSDNIKFIFTASEPIDEYLVSYINEIYHLIKFTNGTAVYDLDFYPGRYVIDASLSGYIYESDSVHEEINISEIATSVICEDFAGYVSKDNRYSVCLKDEYGTLISNASVSLTVNGKSYKSITNGSGVAVFKFDLGVGKYGATVEYGGNYKYSKSSAGSTVIIKSTIEMDSNSKFTYNSNYVATLLDSDGNPLKNREVSFGIDEKIYSVFTDSQGVLSYNLKLNPGSYKISILNIESSESKYQTIKVTKRIDSNKDVTMYYAAGKSYSVRVYDDHGNVLKNAKVTFKVNGKTYYRYSNANGYASLKISLNPKTYTITAEYKGYKVSNKIVVKSTLVLSSKTVKRSKTFKYTVKLLNSNGKILKNKKVTVKFRGKTYVAKTNAKGIANYKIKALSKTGKFALTAIYGSLKVSKTITVKK